MADTTDRSAVAPPSSIADTYANERSVGFLELYDLVFVVVVAQLGMVLAAAFCLACGQS